MFHTFICVCIEIAVCCNNHELHIYKKDVTGEWALAHKLKEVSLTCAYHLLNEWNVGASEHLNTVGSFRDIQHDMLISGVDWHASSNSIVTCSHDRNAFVWSEQQEPDGTKTWKPALVILRIDRSALDVKWSPNGSSVLSRSSVDLLHRSSVCPNGPLPFKWTIQVSSLRRRVAPSLCLCAALRRARTVNVDKKLTPHWLRCY